MAKEMTIIQAKEVVGEAMCRSLGISVEMTKAGKLTIKTKKQLNERGYYWFPSLRVWKQRG